jgi:hypothetical protein
MGFACRSIYDEMVVCVGCGPQVRNPLCKGRLLLKVSHVRRPPKLLSVAENVDFNLGRHRHSAALRAQLTIGLSASATRSDRFTSVARGLFQWARRQLVGDEDGFTTCACYPPLPTTKMHLCTHRPRRCYLASLQWR